MAGDIDPHQRGKMIVKIDRLGAGLTGFLVDPHAGFQSLGHAPGKPAGLGIIVERTERRESVDRAVMFRPREVERLAHIGHQRMRGIFRIVGEVE